MMAEHETFEEALARAMMASAKAARMPYSGAEVSSAPKWRTPRDYNAKLRQQILDNLPATSNELAGKLGSSRGSVNDCLKRLEAEATVYRMDKRQERSTGRKSIVWGLAE